MKTKIYLLTATLLLATNNTSAQGSVFEIPTIAAYELHGNVKEVNSVGYYIQDGDTIEHDTLYLLFNREGQLIERKWPTSGDLPNDTYHYDNGKITESLNHDDSSCFLYSYRYGADGCLSEVTRTYSEDGKIIDIDSFYIVCDEQCRITSDGAFYTYTEDGLVATKSYDNNFIIYKYDSQRRLTKQIWKDDGGESITVYIRDAYGNITDEIWTNSRLGSSNRRHISYDLDHHGNWTVLKEDHATYHRTITYYDE